MNHLNYFYLHFSLFKIILLSSWRVFHLILIFAESETRRQHILLTGLTLVERNKNVLVTSKRNRQKEWKREHSCWRVEICSLLDLHSFFFTMLSSLPHSLAAVASSCKGVPALPRSPHTKPSLSPRCRQANNGQPLMQFTRSQGRDVLLGISCVPLAQTPQLPLLWESVTWRFRFSRGPFQGQCVWSWMSAEH